MRPRGALALRFVLAAPLLWLLAFFVAPFAIVLKLSFSRAVTAQPPYEPTFTFADGLSGLIESGRQFTTESYALLFSDWLYLDAYVSSLRIAGLATLIALLIGYPLALAMSRAPSHWRARLIVLAIAPFWTSFLVRVYAWIVILKDEGLLNHALLGMGIISEPLHIFATEGAVLIGLVYAYLPFTVLPIFNALEKQDDTLVEAALDLGATRVSAFWTVTFPLSLPGLYAGALLMFIPATGEFVIPDLLGGSGDLMIGRVLWSEFFSNRDWPMASAAACVLLCVLLAPLLLFERAQSREANT
jgi:putrescine transport system permease protein